MTRDATTVENEPALLWVAELMAPYPHPWWICGGWALDLHLGHVTREHDDVDLAVDARDSAVLHTALASWQVTRTDYATQERVRWRGEPLRPGPDGLSIDGAPHAIEVLGALVDDGEWVFPRGSRRIRRPARSAFLTSSAGLPYQAPEIVLLYKARQLRDRDDADFRTLLPTLDDEQRAWLVAALPDDHLWAAGLRDPR